MNIAIRNIFTFTIVLIIGLSNVAAQDTCKVNEYVRQDGLMIRGMEYETIYVLDSLDIMCAMYAVDKDYFFVIHIDDPQQLMKGKKMHNDLAIQLSDSTVILLQYSTNKSQRSKNSYDGYFKIQSKDMGYIEKYTLVRVNYMIDDTKKYFFVTRNNDVMKRHYNCLVKK